MTMLTPASSALVHVAVSVILNSVYVHCGVIDENPEKKLLNDLLFHEHIAMDVHHVFNLSEPLPDVNVMTRYNRDARPVWRAEQQVNVSVWLTVLRVERVDEKEQVLHTEVIIRRAWSDYQLSWDPRSYANITSILIPSDVIWTPDIYLFNNAHGQGADRRQEGRHVMVKADGSVTWTTHHFLSSHCSLDLRRFPYDVQQCALLFGSWAYDISKVRLKLADRHHATVFHDNSRKEWFVSPFKATRMQFQWPGFPATYDFLHFTMSMTRDSVYHRYVLFLPGIFLCFLNIFVILLPPESGEKMSLGIGIVIALILMLSILEGFLPTDMSSVPLIAKYYGFTLVLAVTYMALTSWVLTMYHQEPKKGRIPNWLQKIFRCKCFKFLLSRDLWTRLSDADGSNDRYVFNVDEGARPLEEVRPITEDAAPMAVSTDPDVTTERALCDISSDMKYLIEILKRRRQVQRSQWYYLALAVNKMACFIYIIGTILITVIILSP